MTELDREVVAGYLQVVDESQSIEQRRATTINNLVQAALHTDGAHHKQWYLYQIAETLGLPTSGVNPGIAP